MRTLLFTLCACVVLVAATQVTADWDPEDGWKMHFPQFPDPNGWDVNITRDSMFDDWTCTQSGPVDDIHFWGSWDRDYESAFVWIRARIWSDVPANDTTNILGYSHPGQMLWEYYFSPNEFTIRGPYQGDQGWFDPQEPVSVIPSNHMMYYQINFEKILNPFYQEEGTTYWLDLHAAPVDANASFGWKTSLDHWKDDAVYYWASAANPDGWEELIDPYTGASLDLAFVITPEPATMTLLGVGALALIKRRRN